MKIENGFQLLEVTQIKELKTEAGLYRHVKTGARLLSLCNDDENKVFGITFRTPPKNSTGIAHILEHSVLCGSRKYPVKEPFVELLKGSLNTFLNAMTFPDKTCYPVASQNLQDFYNLVDVYLDSVLHPRITPFVLQQEGWHYDVESTEGPLRYKGVVFNEMKGAYSSPQGYLAEKSQQLVFPDITYGLDSGGDPKHIPRLSYEEFKAFHKTHYHPSNSWVFFCGDDDPQERLKLVDEYFKDFDPIEVDTTVPLQTHMSAPRRETLSYASSSQGPEGSGETPKSMITVNWLLPEVTDTPITYSCHILRHILIGMPGSPLRKALIDSELGSDTTGIGLETDLRQMYFSVGLKGIQAENADKVEDLVIKTLESLVSRGIDREAVEAAVNTIEFALRENNTGSYPRGLVVMLRALTAWLYDHDPIAPLKFEEPMKQIKARLEAKEPYFENFIQKHFLGNPHRVTLLLEPDPELAEQLESEEKDELAAVQRSMSREEMEALTANTQELRRLQETPDTPEALAAIPCLKLSDLDKRDKEIPLEVLREKGTEILIHDLFTSGIAYLDMGFDLHHLPQHYVPYFRLFARALTEMGTQKDDYVKLGLRIARKTGGIHPDIFTSSIYGQKHASMRLFLRTKCMMHQVEDLLGILNDLIHTVKLDNRERFRQMLLEEKARQEHKLIPAGHQVVNLRLRAHFSEADWAGECMSGASYLAFLRQLCKDMDQPETWPKVLGILEDIKRVLFNSDAMVFNITLDASNWGILQPHLEGFIHSLPCVSTSQVPWTPDHYSPFEGMSIPTQVNYVGKGHNLFQEGYTAHGSAHVISGYLRTSWLWDRIRVQGGAYGAFCMFDRISGTFTLVSYRDPNLFKTLDNFDKAARFLRETPLNEAELHKAVIGAIGKVDTYRLPDTKGYVSMLRHLIGETDAMRQQKREEILDTSIGDFRRFGELMENLAKKGIVKVLGAETTMLELEKAHPGKFKISQLL